MSKSNTERGIGRIINEKSTTTIVWKIRNYFSLPQKKGRCYESPSFSFLNAKWCLQILPNGESENDSVGWIGLYLIMLHSSTKPPHIRYTLGIRNGDGSIYHNWNTEHQFTFNEDGYGLPRFIPNSEISKNVHKILPNKTLTIFCILSDKNHEWTLSCESSQAYLEDQKNEDDRAMSPEDSCSKEKDNFEASKLMSPNPTGLESFCKNLKDLLLSERLCDLKILVNDEEFRAHKTILAAHSPVFAAMFENEMAEKHSGIVEISDSKPEVFRDFLHYLYTSSTEDVPPKHVCGVYMLADKYDVKHLKDECLTIMNCKLSVDNFCDVISLAVKYDESEVLKKATDFFVKNTKMILQTIEWQSFIVDAPTIANELFLKTVG